MNEYILSKMAKITTCYELIIIYYIVGADILNCYINVNASYTSISVLRCHKENLFCQRD